MGILKDDASSNDVSRGLLNHSESTILVVDDMAPNLAVMSAILRPYFTVIEAQSGEEALRLLANMENEQRIGCIVSDHRMAGMTGVELLQKAKEIRPTVPRIVVSGYLDVDAVIEAVNKASVFKFIIKPFDASEFLEAVKEAVTVANQFGNEL